MFWNDDNGRGNLLIASIVGFLVGKVLFGSIGVFFRLAKWVFRKIAGLFRQLFIV